MKTRCFALLDDCLAKTPRSRLYTECCEVLICHHIDEYDTFLNTLEERLQQGFYAVVICTYELGTARQGVAHHAVTPLATILLFKHVQILSTEEVNAWLTQQASISASPPSVFNVTSSDTESVFKTHIDRIRDYIAQGDTYQVNYTYRLYFHVAGSPLALYQTLRQKQAVPYAAYIQLPDDQIVLSLSPELFIQHQDHVFTARPMKGTARASTDVAINAARQTQLSQDPKNQAENVMIVDLLRNDLGRLAQTGSVHVPALFSVDQFGQVLQMTSTIQATPKTDLHIKEIVDAVYPCGSITGAPKRRTMEIIHALEASPRKVYTGAIGWFDPIPAALPEFCLSVPIRTLLLSADNAGIRQGEMGIGAGITYASDAQDEYEECQLKATFLTDIAMDIGLIETIFATKETGYRYLDQHIARLSHSASQLGIPLSLSDLQWHLSLTQVALVPKTPHKVRILLSTTGNITITASILQQALTPVSIVIAAHSITPTLLLQHKTTDRTLYNATLEKAIHIGAFDAIFFNDRGELTEGCRSNVFVRVNGQWCTPPLQCGVLPGIMRQRILDDTNWQAIESVISKEEVLASSQIMVCNALHGPLFTHLNTDVTL